MIAKAKSGKARKAHKGSMSEVLRSLIRKHPNTPPTTILKFAERKGLKPSLALVNKIKYGRGDAPKASAPRSASKASAIREKIAALGPDARTKDVIAACAEDGITVSSAQVSTLKKKPLKRRSTDHANGNGNGHLNIEQLLAAKKFVNEIGGPEAARDAINCLSMLMAAN